MIILFEENELDFTSLGLGVLKDARSCSVKETLNDAYELILEYPITGSYYDKLKINRIVFAKPNPYADAQPFRIYQISKPIKGIVTINAFHLSYDMNGIIVGPVSATSLKDAIDKIQNGSLLEHNFHIITEKSDLKTFKTNNYYNMRALVLGSDGSLLAKFGGELYFDKWNVYLLNQRGSNKGAEVRYAKNLKDITHEISYDKLYNGVYPFYHQETTTTTTTTSEEGFRQVYIVGHKPFQDGWLSYNPEGEPYHPVDESPVQIATEGNYYQKVYTWNTITQRFVERIYNEMVTLIDSLGGLLQSNDTPSWIYIDWTKLPYITVKANADGYFKPVTEQDWKYYKKGDVVLEDSIKNIATNLIIYYAEVIPTSKSAETEESTSIVHVELDNKIIWLETDAAKEMKFNRILSLDLTSEFEEAPEKEALEAKAKEYIEKNKIGQYKYNTTVSFVDLSSTTEGVKYKNIEHIELGDVVKVVYEDLGVNVDLRVISTEYNVILNRYNKIELGEKPDKISAESIQNGDNVSSLTNDIGYTDITTVNKLVAKMITADYIKAKNAELSKAQIEQLTTARIKVTGMIEATQFELDSLVAKLLTADNAVIKETLEAGTVKVKGDITVASGEISIISTKEDGTSTVFKVDRNGNLEANSVKITGGELNINDTFTVTPDGILTAQGADITGTIRVLNGEIGTSAHHFNIGGDDSNNVAYIYSGMTSLDDTDHEGIYIGTDGISLGKGKFRVTKDGVITIGGYATDEDLEEVEGDIPTKVSELTNDSGYQNATQVTTITENTISTTNVTAQNLVVSLANVIGILTVKDSSNNILFKADTTNKTVNICDFTVAASSIYNGRSSLSGYNSNGGIYIGTDGISLGIGSLLDEDAIEFRVTKDGALTANSATIKGSITATSGYIGNDTHYFIIGASGSLETDKAYIYSGMTSLDDTDHEGIYIGTDGISLGGGAFKVTKDGAITIGGYATETWVEGQGYQDSEGVETVITNTEVTAQNLKVNFANITGALVVTDGTNEIFKVDREQFIANLGNFKIDKDGLAFIQNDVELISIKPDKLKYGSNFEVTSDGILTAKEGTIAGFEFTQSGLSSDLVDITPSLLKYGDNFMVDADGYLSMTNGSISIQRLGLAGSNLTIINNSPVTSTVTSISITSSSISSDRHSVYASFSITLDNAIPSRAKNATIRIVIKASGYTAGKTVNIPTGSTTVTLSNIEFWFGPNIIILTTYGISISSYQKIIVSHSGTPGVLRLDDYPILMYKNAQPATNNRYVWGYDEVYSDVSGVCEASIETYLNGIAIAVATYDTPWSGDSGYENYAISLGYSVGNSKINVRWNNHQNRLRRVKVFYIGYLN